MSNDTAAIIGWLLGWGVNLLTWAVIPAFIWLIIHNINKIGKKKGNE